MANEIYLNLDDSTANTIVDLGTAFEAKVISGDAITFTTSANAIDTESGDPTDDLDTIANGGTLKLLLLRSMFEDHVITVKHGTGNILTLDGATDIVLDDPNKILMLIYNGTYWVCMALGGGGGVIPTGTWCYEWDFTASDGGWVVPSGYYGQYIASTGWSTDEIFSGSSQRYCTIQMMVSPDTEVTEVEVDIDGSVGQCTVQLFNGGSVIANYNDPSPGSGAHTFSVDVTDTVVDEVRVFMQRTIADESMSLVRLFGTGTNPFGSDNC